jgi:hypothetical protein
MIENVSAVSVLWNEAARVEGLLTQLTAHFPEVVVVVQKSSDRTLLLAERVLRGHQDIVVEDEWRGAGDFSMPLALSHVRNEWAFVVSGDEIPSDDLLASIPDAVAQMERDRNDGAFIECQERIEGVPYVEHGRHVRLFRTSTGWEARLHSAATHENVIRWPIGHIQHDRSLNEVFEDYLRYIRIAEEAEDGNLVNLNINTIYRAANLVADAKGWKYVHAQPAWPEVERRVFALVPRSMEVL